MVAKLAAQFRYKLVTQPDEGVENPGYWGAPDFRAIDARGKTWCRRASGFGERVAIVGTDSRKHAIVACNGSAHAEVVKKPGAVRCKEPRLKIEVKERLGFELVVLTQEFEKSVAAEMVDHTGR